MFDRRAAALLVLALAAVLGLTAPGFSSASFTSSSTSQASITAAVDWTPPVVTMGGISSPAKDTVTLTATASDGETGVQDVVFEYLPSGGSSWVTACTSTTAPWSCSWNTKPLTDGSYEVRARATDRAGYATTSDAVRVTVANTTLVVLAEPGDLVRGTVPLSATVYNAGGLTYTVRIEYTPAGTTSWKSICSNLSTPYTCSWVTTAAAYTNTEYDLRAVATSGGSTLTSVVIPDVSVDNLAPVVTMTDPGTPLRGTRTFAATASDANSGVAQVVIQYAVTGTSTWKVLCTITVAPYSCRYDTTTIADGSYGFRAVATDLAGNATTSTTVANRLVDNTVSSVSMEDPGAFLSGTTTLLASATSTSGVTSVRIQYAATGTSTWTDVCTDTATHYSCAWDTTKVVDGFYDFRAILVDGAGGTTTSTVLTGPRVDNTPLRGTDVQAVNGGAATGRFEANDSVTLTYSDQVNLATITSGWTGAAQAVTVRLRDGNILGLGNKGDTLDVQRTGGTVNLGSVNLREEYVKTNRTVSFNATMTAGTVTVNGIVRTTVTLRLGTIASGSAASLRTTSLTAAMIWSPSAAVSDLNGRVCSVSPVTESGTLDRDF
ncbi:Ig-like domain-containing protein [Knoellia locipacati]|uniref:Ig-like domain-containing protein n=1 Tax=Knoellia locipacati TaxID=882824 RepID=UPI00384C26D4